MSLLTWSERLALGHPMMDETHEEFVGLLNDLGTAEGDQILVRLDAFIAHTEKHFSQENAWMEELQYPRIGCHRNEHANILEVVREVRTRVAGGEQQYGRTLAEALAEWFPVHAASMDAMLAAFMQFGADALPECSHEGSDTCPHSGPGGEAPQTTPAAPA
jgi:hemerythrin-like metal-binding protein